MEALIGVIGVIIASLIGYGAVMTTLFIEHRRWIKQFKLQYLIMERKRREEQCDKIRELLVEGLREDMYSDELAIEMFIRLPLKIKILIQDAWKETDHSDDEAKRKLYQKVSLFLGTYLSKIDKQIEELTQ